ncbi:MAG: class I SAM-dependent methyltransferase [Dehalococcoidia bacterium]|nr:class I SAM-dependent methyltransferase [Dehalococcoidia bacterium]
MVKDGDIKSHWSKVAKEGVACAKEIFPLKFCGTFKDYNIQHLEMRTLLGYIEDGNKVVEIGCGKGYTTLFMAWAKKISILGVDYSEEMISVAMSNKIQIENKLKGDVTFNLGDVADLKLNDVYDIAYTERCLINVPTWEDQKAAIRRISQILKHGGLFLMLEGSKQGLMNLNKLRTQNGLNEIQMVWHNLFFDDQELIRFAADFFELIEVNNFCSTYMLISRVLHPALIFPDQPKYEARINELAVGMPNFGDFGYEKLYVFRKK